MFVDGLITWSSSVPNLSEIEQSAASYSDLKIENVGLVVVVVVVVLYSPNTNRYITDKCKTNDSIKHIWQVAREAPVLPQLATYS